MNYRTLIIAGYGTIGRSIARLGKKELALFDSVIAFDKDFTRHPTDADCIDFFIGDIEDTDFLTALCRKVRPPALLLNVATGTDNVEIRKVLSAYDVAYLDSCASSLPDKMECRFSRYMPYTYSAIPSRYPHWLCWGINPGLVEIMARKLIREMGDGTGFEVSVYESDQLQADWDEDAVAVGWSPEMLVEEVMLSPTLQISDGRPVERSVPGTDAVTAFWRETPVASRIVGHEDIWNIGQMDRIHTARFIYGLHPEVMAVFNGDPDAAVGRLKVPDESIPIYGTERVAVRVERIDDRAERSLVWETNHQAVWKKHGVNAVQYQTGKSLLLAISLLQKTTFGKQPISACASDLPITAKGWDTIDAFMDRLDIQWDDADSLNLSAI
jgi:hypothetical protein